DRRAVRRENARREPSDLAQRTRLRKLHRRAVVRRAHRVRAVEELLVRQSRVAAAGDREHRRRTEEDESQLHARVLHSRAVEHPIQLVVEDDLRRSRLTVFFRWLLAIPHWVWLTLWGFVAGLAAFAGWFIALFTGRLPDGLHGFLARYLRYQTQVLAYTL